MSPRAQDIGFIWTYVISTVLVVGFFAFLGFVFSGRVKLTDPVVAGLVGATITQVANIVSQIASHYFAPKPDESQDATT